VSVNAAMAATYAHAGWKTFPCWWVEDGQCVCPRGSACKSPGKHPLFAPAHPADSPERTTCRGECGKVGHGLYDATADLDVLARWWGRYPAAHNGLPADGNGLAVLDVDPGHGGGESFIKLRDYTTVKGVHITDTLTARTGSGGRHFVYGAPEGGVKGGTNVFGIDMPGLDVRGRGHYIIVAPSGHASGGTYEWVDFFAELQPWPVLLTRLMEPAKPKREEYRGPARPPSDQYAAAALTNECEAVAATAPGGRNDQLNRSAFNLGTLVGAGLLDKMLVCRELAAAARSAGLGESEIATTILSGLRQGTANPRAARA